MSLGFLLLLGLVGLGLVIDGRRRAARAAQHPDQATLDALVRAGSDLRLPHELEYYLYLPTEPAGNQVAATLRSEGFTVQVSPDEGGREWLCLAAHRMRPDLAALERLRVQLSSLATAAGGEYDGWGATVVLPPDRGDSPG